jgi:hypothetical protein
MLRTHEEIVLAILNATAPADMTSKEIARRFHPPESRGFTA